MTNDTPSTETLIQIKPIPNEMLKIVPQFGGDKRQLNLFLRKCEYLINRFRGHDEQDIYVFNAITSRLVGDAAALISEREDITSWSALKSILQQHFGDPRSEECINIELETCKIKSGESFLEFCCRIQNIRSLLISKVNLIPDAEIKRAKIAIYSNTALNVFLYNLPEDMVRVVRLKAPSTLEAALSIVLEEVNFHEQYTLRNRMGSRSAPTTSAAPTTGFRFGNTAQKQLVPQNNFAIPQKFNFGIPQNTQNIRPNFNNQNFGFKPQLGYRPQFPQQPAQQQFGYKPQFGYRPQLGYRPPQFGPKPQNMSPQQFGYKPQQVQKPHFQSTDVSMRTAPPRPQQAQQGFRLNEITSDDDVQYCDEYGYDVNDYDRYYATNDVEYVTQDAQYYDETNIANDTLDSEAVNFQIQASNINQKL